MRIPPDVQRFFLLACGITWVCQVPFVLVQRGVAVPLPAVMLLAVVGAAGPALAAALLSRRETGSMRAIFGVRGNLAWLPIALFTPMLLHVVPAFLFSLAGLPVDTTPAMPSNDDQVGIAILSPPGEEPGWRGYALPRLQSAMSPVAASVLIGLVWSLWHLPMLFVPGASILNFLVGTVFIVALSVLATFFYNASGGSVLTPIVFHLGIHLDNVTRLGGHPLVVTTVGAAIVAGVLAWRVPSLGRRA